MNLVIKREDRLEETDSKGEGDIYECTTGIYIIRNGSSKVKRWILERRSGSDITFRTLEIGPYNPENVGPVLNKEISGKEGNFKTRFV